MRIGCHDDLQVLPFSAVCPSTVVDDPTRHPVEVFLMLSDYKPGVMVVEQQAQARLRAYWYRQTLFSVATRFVTAKLGSPFRAILFFVSETQPLKITIRPALSGDAEGITRIYLESAEYHASIDPERYSVPRFETILARYREGQHHPAMGGQGITFVAEVDGAIVGFVDAGLEQSHDLMHREITYSHVAEIAVGGQHQNQGIGGRLLQAVEDWGRKMGAEFASLEFNNKNKRAGLFYQKLGYGPASITAIKRL
jgi:GNAT superfamily N-acetyltransferase